MPSRPVALVTGASRPHGIGAACGRLLAEAGWDIALVGWSPYDVPMRDAPGGFQTVLERVRQAGARAVASEIDLGAEQAAAQAFDLAAELGAVSALVLAHCVDIPGDLLTTPPEEFERHLALNVTASWRLMCEMATRQDPAERGGSIVAFTSDALDSSAAYGISKGALDRLVVAAARQWGERGITANAINPGPTETGWIDAELRARLEAEIPLGRVGTPTDCARLVVFLCSPEGGYVTGQLLHSNGGLR